MKDDAVESPKSKSEASKEKVDKEQKPQQNKQPTRERSRRRKPSYLTDNIVREISPHHQPLTEKTKDETNQDDRAVAAGDDPGSAQTMALCGKRTVQCNICKRQMMESKLANHIRLLHVEAPPEETTAGKRKEFKCEYCGKLYAIKYTYEQHKKTHIEGRPKCPECGSTFASAFSLFRHRAKNHNLEHNYQLHTCDQCNKSFFSVSELRLHQQRHSTEKEFQCTECKKAFSVKGNLRIHMRTHAKEKLYKCDICENSFSHPYSLVSHRRIHTNDFPFKCPDCDKGRHMVIM